MLFVSAKVSHLGILPQGQPERNIRVQKMVKTMDEAGFGNCTNTGACEVECPKGIKMTNISNMNADFIKSMLFSEVEM
jgi:succinate dehydrogenase / fumarate reductase iron-sulfur subunit